jgi:hypothetical protein
MDSLDKDELMIDMSGISKKDKFRRKKMKEAFH